MDLEEKARQVLEHIWPEDEFDLLYLLENDEEKAEEFLEWIINHLDTHRMDVSRMITVTGEREQGLHRSELVNQLKHQLVQSKK